MNSNPDPSCSLFFKNSNLVFSFFFNLQIAWLERKTIITKRENIGTTGKQNETKVNKMAKMTKIKQYTFRVEKVKVLKPFCSLFQW